MFLSIINLYCVLSLTINLNSDTLLLLRENTTKNTSRSRITINHKTSKKIFLQPNWLLMAISPVNLPFFNLAVQPRNLMEVPTSCEVPELRLMMSLKRRPLFQQAFLLQKDWKRGSSHGLLTQTLFFAGTRNLSGLRILNTGLILPPFHLGKNNQN